MRDFQKEEELLRLMRELGSGEFEEFVGSLWELQGWEVDVTGLRDDKGKDIIAKRQIPFEMEVNIQAKRYGEENKIVPRDVREYALDDEDSADLAVIVTSGYFTTKAKEQAERRNVKRVNGPRLVNLVQKLNAEPLLTDDLSVTDVESIHVEEMPEWTSDIVEEGTPIDTLEGVGAERAEKLEDVGVVTIEDLMAADLTEVAEKTGFAETRLERWRNLVIWNEGHRVDVL
ncbi:MAG: restriction endonuclease, partial [Halobacteriaceae archaeon]